MRKKKKLKKENMVELNLGMPEEKPKTKKYEKHYRAKYV